MKRARIRADLRVEGRACWCSLDDPYPANVLFKIVIGDD
jgi:hypothetical protein